MYVEVCRRRKGFRAVLTLRGLRQREQGSTSAGLGSPLWSRNALYQVMKQLDTVLIAWQSLRSFHLLHLNKQTTLGEVYVWPIESAVPYSSAHSASARVYSTDCIIGSS